MASWFGFVFVIFSSLILLSLNSDSLESEFQNFIKKYKRTYVEGSLEYLERFKIFRSNLALHAELNLHRDNHGSALYGINKFSDLSQQEFKEKYLSGYGVKNEERKASAVKKFQPTRKNYGNHSKSMDWRDRHCVTEPRNQKNCGGCWAFASMETIETMSCLKTTNLVALSVQEMIDCSYQYNQYLNGCQGGDTCLALNWALQLDVNLVPESAYPLEDTLQKCNFNILNTTKGVKVQNYTCYNYSSQEEQILEILSNYGPVTVSVDASNWNNYMGGIIQFHCGDVPRNHAVQIVGYNLAGDIPYYIVKNSWGTDFGHGGYLYVKYGSDVCLIAEEVSTVVVADAS